MNFKVDENLPAEIAQELRAAGHDADTVADQGLAGSPDREIAAKAQSEARSILTMDLGIADIRAYPPEQYAVLFCYDHTVRGAVLRWHSSGAT